MFRVCSDRMLNDLDPGSLAFWIALCDGMTVRRIEQAGIVPGNSQAELRRRIRQCFKKHFGR